MQKLALKWHIDMAIHPQVLNLYAYELNIYSTLEEGPIYKPSRSKTPKNTTNYQFQKSKIKPGNFKVAGFQLIFRAQS